MHASSSVCEKLGTGNVNVDGVSTRLIVAWQHPISRLISPAGVLDRETGRYRFRYIRCALDIEDFRPFVGFPDLYRTYDSVDLFPIFQQRVMSARRPDYEQYVAKLALPVGAEPWDQLSRSGGRRVGDAIHLFSEPHIAPDGETELLFLVHGVRHIEEAIDGYVQRRIEKLSQGDALVLVAEPTNPVNSRAVQVCTLDGHKFGWVPDLMLNYVAEVTTSGATFNVCVEHVNGETVPHHFRLLVKLHGWVRPGYRPFDGEEWLPLTGS